jgi:regulator of replication initiation timing
MVLSKEQLDKITIEFLNRKIERMHKEIEYYIDENSKIKNENIDCIEMLDRVTYQNDIRGEKIADALVIITNGDNWTLSHEITRERLREVLKNDP